MKPIEYHEIDLLGLPTGDKALRIRDQLVTLSPGGFAQLCRIGTEWARDVEATIDTGPPYVVGILIPYIAADGEFGHPAAFTERDMAERAIPLFRAELRAMGFTAARGFKDVNAVEIALLAIPELRFEVSQLEYHEDIASALAEFRLYTFFRWSPGLSARWMKRFGVTKEDALRYGDAAVPIETFRLKQEENL